VFAQSAIAGTVKDTSGAVLPGVTVEAASAVLIEKAKTVVTDSEGNYKIVDLRPGSYVLTFSLEGFSTVKREGLELPSNFTMTINSELKVGSLQEALTVTGRIAGGGRAEQSEDPGAVARCAGLGAQCEDDSEPRTADRRSHAHLLPRVGGSRAMQAGVLRRARRRRRGRHRDRRRLADERQHGGWRRDGLTTTRR